MVIDVTSESFQRDVIERSYEVPVVVDFWAAWCGPCRMLGPVLEQLAAEDEGRWVLAKVDTDANQDIAGRYRIQGIPAVKGFRNGEVVQEFVGAQPAPMIREWLSTLMPSEADGKVEEADAARKAGDTDAAITGYEAALALQADHPEALLSLAELVPDRGAELLARLPPRLNDTQTKRRGRIALKLETGGESSDTLRAAVEATPDDLEARWKLAHTLEADDDHDGALEHLLEIVRRDRAFRDDGARKAMIQIFDVLGRCEITDRWRQRLAMELYK